MAISVSRLPKWPIDAPGMGIFARSEDKDFRIADGQEVEIFFVVHDGGAAVGSIQTTFEMVKGGYISEIVAIVDVATTPGSAIFAYSVTAPPTAPGASDTVLDVKPNADPTIADLSGLPLSAKLYFVVIFGYKLPETL